MFENLYCEKLRFNWNNMTVYIKVGGDYHPLNLDIFECKGLKDYYLDWEDKLNMLCVEYRDCRGPKFNDCPVNDSLVEECHSLLNKKELRVEINMFIFVGIHFGYITWQWNNYFQNIGAITLFKKWFNRKD